MGVKKISGGKIMNMTKLKGFKRFTSAILSIAVIISATSFQLTAAYGEEEEITYAHTIDYVVDLRNIGDEEGQTPAKGDGYEWDDETSTLTLNNLHMDFSEFEDIGGMWTLPYGIVLPSGREEITVILNGANKVTDASIINDVGDTPKVTMKGGSGDREKDSLEVVCTDENRYKKLSALGLGRNAYIEDLTMKMDLYWGSNFTNLTVKNSDVTITSDDSSPIYCLGYFRASDSNLYLETKASSGSSPIMANMAASDYVPETDPYICDEPVNISNCNVSLIVPPTFASMYASEGNIVISDSTIDCGNALIGLYIGGDITINNSDIKNECLTADTLSGKINIDKSSNITGILRERASGSLTAYGKYTQTNTNIIGAGYTFTVDENAEITMADGISMQVTGGTLINNGIIKGDVEKTSGTIICNNHCLTDVMDNEDGTHTGRCSVCGEENIQAKEITFTAGDNRTTVYIAPPKLNKNLIPEIPAAENMKFECWSETKAENAADDAKPFDFEQEVTKDITLYAVFSREFTETDEAAIDLVYNREITVPVNLSDYVKFADDSFDTDGQFEFTVSSGAILLDGLELNSDGTITGKPTADVKEGGYTVEFVVTDKNPYISLAALEPETASKKAVLTVNFNIQKADPTVTVQKAEGLVYDTEEKELIDYDNTSTDGGEILYSIDNVNYSDEIPKGTDAGDYTIWYKVTGDNNYNDTEPESITVAIAKANPVYEIPEGLTAGYGSVLSDIELPDGFSWNDSTQSTGSIGTNTFKATYTPKDTDNYNIMTDIDITVNVLPPEEQSPYGDVDGEEGLTVNDAVCLLRKVLDNNYTMPIEEETEEYMIYADVDGDGVLMAADAAEIIKKVMDSNFKFKVEK